MSLLFNYFVRISPGVVLLSLTYFLLPKKENVFKIYLLLFGFILMRDAMTPLSLWEFGITDHIIWLRFIENPLVLLTIGFLSLVISLFLYHFIPELKTDFKWFATSKKWHAIVTGVLMPVIVIGPFVLFYASVPLLHRGGEVPSDLLFPLLFFSLFGNFLEELLFRGYLQGYFKKQQLSANKRVLLSGLFFSIGHIFLALTVTNLGILILLFTFWEGIICATIHEKYGLVSATLTHGLSIFLLASGLF